MTKKNLLITGSAGVEVPIYKNKEIINNAIISADDFELISKYKWRLTDKGYAVYITRYSENGKRKTRKILMHRLIMNPEDEFEIDHINLNRLDNRRENLRIVTRRENMFNKNMYQNNKAGYKGVYFKDFTYRAEIGFENKNICLGSYDNAEDAALAYNIKAIELFGEYANLNILSGDFVKNNKERITNIINNVGKPKSSTGYWGVFYEKRSGKYVPEIKKDKKKYWIGKFDTAQEAAEAYNKKAIELFGSKAKLNKVDE